MKNHMVRIPIEIVVWAQVEAETREIAIDTAKRLCNECSFDVDPDGMVENNFGNTTRTKFGEIEISDDRGNLIWTGKRDAKGELK